MNIFGTKRENPNYKTTHMKMKTSHLLLIPAVAMLAITGCKSKKAIPVQKETGAVEISVPFSSKEYQTDEHSFRAKQVGKSPDQSTAKKIALQSAKAELAGNINSVMKRVTDQYTNQRTVGNTQEFENKFEELAREVVNLEMSNVRTIGEKIFREADGAYSYWVAVEANKKEVFEKLDARISNDDKLKLDYDKQKFQQIFDAEMKKLAEEGR